jgi:hypothetical protein
MMVQLFLGTGSISWVSRTDLASVPKCVSLSRVLDATRQTLRPAACDVLLDSGGFSELQRHGRWRSTPAQFLDQIERAITTLGPDRVVGVAAQDWMCEDLIIYGGRTKDGAFVGTRRVIDPDRVMTRDELVVEHQRRTVDNFTELRRLAPGWLARKIFPVVQGYELGEHVACARRYAAAGVDLAAEPIVGVGSICRRQADTEAAAIIGSLHDLGLRNLHGFGVSGGGLALYGRQLRRADSMAWSYAARRRATRCVHGVVKWERNCPIFAVEWWTRALGAVAA